MKSTPSRLPGLLVAALMGILVVIFGYSAYIYFESQPIIQLNPKLKETLAKDEMFWQKLISEELERVKKRLDGAIPVLTEKGEISDYLGPKSDVPLWVIEELGKVSSYRMNKAGMEQMARVVRGHCQFAEGPDTCSIEAVQEYVYKKFREWAADHNYRLVSFVAYDTTKKLPNGAQTHESRLFIGAAVPINK